jgi:hypothetical protein
MVQCRLELHLVNGVSGGGSSGSSSSAVAAVAVAALAALALRWHIVYAVVMSPCLPRAAVEAPAVGPASSATPPAAMPASCTPEQVRTPSLGTPCSLGVRGSGAETARAPGQSACAEMSIHSLSKSKTLSRHVPVRLIRRTSNRRRTCDESRTRATGRHYIHGLIKLYYNYSFIRVFFEITL